MSEALPDAVSGAGDQGPGAEGGEGEAGPGVETHEAQQLEQYLRFSEFVRTFTHFKPDIGHMLR